MVKTCETLEYICNASQRLRILDILNGTQMGIRDLMDVLDSPRSTVQRNVSGLEKRGWVHRTASGYTTTTAGEILCENMVELNKAISKIRCLKPFFETVDAPPEMSINCLTDVVVTTPESGKPNAPTKRLFTAFKDADRVRGFIPVIADFAVKLFQNAERSAIDDEYIVPADVFDVLDEQYTSDWADKSEKSHSIRLYEGDIPYGLFISDKQVAVGVYDEVDRMDMLVESTSEEVIKWGEKIYDSYKHQSTDAKEGMPYMEQNAE